MWLGRGAGFMVLGVIMLSLVPLIGWAGQVSFANFAIAGIGAVLFSHFGGQNGDPIGILLVMAVCAAARRRSSPSRRCGSRACTWPWPPWRSPSSPTR